MDGYVDLGWMCVVGCGGGGEAMVLVCLPLAAPIGLSPLHVSTVFWLCQRSPWMTCPV